MIPAVYSRIKDFFDLHYLAGHFEFDRATLAEAVGRTFARRGTPIAAEAPRVDDRVLGETRNAPKQSDCGFRGSPCNVRPIDVPACPADSNQSLGKCARIDQAVGC